jgi:hypothetical protein
MVSMVSNYPSIHNIQVSMVSNYPDIRKKWYPLIPTSLVTFGMYIKIGHYHLEVQANPKKTVLL